MNLASIVLLLQLALSLLSSASNPNVPTNIRQQAINFSNQAIELALIEMTRVSTQQPIQQIISQSQPSPTTAPTISEPLIKPFVKIDAIGKTRPKQRIGISRFSCISESTISSENKILSLSRKTSLLCEDDKLNISISVGNPNPAFTPPFSCEKFGRWDGVLDLDKYSWEWKGPFAPYDHWEEDLPLIGGLYGVRCSIDGSYVSEDLITIKVNE